MSWACFLFCTSLLKAICGIQPKLDSPDDTAAYVIGQSGISVKEEFIFFEVIFKGAKYCENIPCRRRAFIGLADNSPSIIFIANLTDVVADKGH